MEAPNESLLVFKTIDYQKRTGTLLSQSLCTADATVSNCYGISSESSFATGFHCTTSLFPCGVGRVPDGEEGGELLDEGIALQIALVVLRAL